MNTQDTKKLASTQYASADKLRARWELLDHAYPQVDIYGVGIDRLKLTGAEDILDAGCGDGSVLMRLRRRGHTGRLVGLEISNEMYRESAEAMKREGIPPVEFSTGSADHLLYPNRSFDLIFAFFMLYHMPDIQKTLHEWTRVLKDGVRLLVATGSQFNKPKNKAFKKMAESLTGKKAPSQFSSSFNMENARQQLSDIFTVMDSYTYKGEIEL